MNPAAPSPSTLRLLVKLYNQSIQSYYFFPDVILCGNFRVEREEFEVLLSEGYLTVYHTDSFGKLYHLSAKAEDCLRLALRRRRQALHRAQLLSRQTRLLFSEAGAV